MLKKLFLIFLVFFIFLVSSSAIFAFDLTRPNNKFGIHLAQPSGSDIKWAAELVNSSGGKWGYITLVIQENDRDTGKWQEVFNQLRRLHLIPIIRIATSPIGDYWRRPDRADADSWVKFLDSLNWVVKDRYIILFNEPNHGAEWGGAVDAENYAEVASEFAKKLKEKNQDFFIMISGLDAAAPSNPPLHEDEAVFLQKIQASKFKLLDSIDGWSSHSYPNHGYVGSPYDVGRTSIRGYQWELDYLGQIGVVKDLPVFITETGWPHGGNYFTPDVVGQNLKIAYEQIWGQDARVRAVTPFILNYQGEPFLQFSWIKPGEQESYPHYNAVLELSKPQGEPEVKEVGKIIFEPPKELLVKSSYILKLKIKNEGQAIWDSKEGYYLKIDGFDEGSYLFSELENIEPGQERSLNLRIRTDDQPGEARALVNLYKGVLPAGRQVLGEKTLVSKTWSFKKLSLPKLSLKVYLFPSLRTQDDQVELKILDEENRQVFKKKGKINEVSNIALNRKYKAIISRNGYLPKQRFITFQKGQNKLNFGFLWPDIRSLFF